MPTRGRARRRCRRAAAAAALVGVALLAAGCGSGSGDGGGTFTPGGTAGDAGGAGATTSTARPGAGKGGAKASRSDPLAQRVFRFQREPGTTAERSAVQALQRYLDALVTAFATNQLGNLGRYTTRDLRQDAQRLVATQVNDGIVTYGPYAISLDPREVRGRVAVIGACIDQSRTREHDARSDKVKGHVDDPFVRLDYTLNLNEGSWRVSGYSAKDVSACPS